MVSVPIRTVTVQRSGLQPFQLAYREELPPPSTPASGTVVLIHGFPQTSYQYRHVMPLLAQRGYRSIAPDVRGVGESSTPAGSLDFSKSGLAADMVAFLDVLRILEPVDVVGHDIGGMIAYALACHWPERVRTLCFGECPIPGTQTYIRDITEPLRIRQQFHFYFHTQPELASALVAGKEREYISHFIDKIAWNKGAFNEEDIQEYTAAYGRPFTMQNAMRMYAAFPEDAEENRAHLKSAGRLKCRALVLSGSQSWQATEAEEMCCEVVEDGFWSAQLVNQAGHYVAEENPIGFVEALSKFLSYADC